MLGFAKAPPAQVAVPTQVNWTQLGSYTPPVVRYGATVVNDVATGQLLVFGGQTPTQVNNGSGLVNDTWTFTGQRWIQLHPPDPPSPRIHAAAARDAAHRVVVLFGGYTANAEVSETWIWDGTAWTQQHPAHFPSPRFGAKMAYDPATQRIILFGGSIITNGVETPFGDTWTWDGTDWTQQTTVVTPPARTLFGFADGSATSAPVLFGGTLGQGESLGDTWVWNGLSNSWVPQATVSAPSGRFGHSMAYDPQLGKTVLYGGSNLGASASGIGFSIGSQTLGDTWTWDGTQWNQISPSGATPDLRVYAGMAFDPANSAMTLFSGGTNTGAHNDTWRFDGSTWTREDLTAPDELGSGMLAREPGSLGTVILFGGGDEYGAVSTQTWRWDGSQWTLLYPAHSPGWGAGGTLTFDPATNSTILFGGYDRDWSNETWSWDGNDWTQLNPATSPLARAVAAATYDGATHQIVLFGGLGNSGVLGDTWTWDGSNWTEQHPANSPPARFTAGMAYNVATQQVVLFGGTVFNQQYFDDTWTWDGINWTQQQPANVPPARAYTAMAYDSGSSSAILFGGCTSCFATPTDSDTWSWDGQDWTQLQPTNAPPGRAAQAMVDGNASSPLLMFGGTRSVFEPSDSGTPNLNDLWAFSAAQPPIPTTVVSRKTHGAAGAFNVDLPLTGNPGIECRSGGANNDHQVILTFAVPVTALSEATVTPGGSGSGNVAGTPIINGNEVTVNLTNVSNAQTLTINLIGVSDGTKSGDVSVPMSVLAGDTNDDGSVNSTDIAQTKSQSGNVVGSSNFRDDVTVDGNLNSGDIALVKSRSGTALPDAFR
jgi:hypothetical protein